MFIKKRQYEMLCDRIRVLEAICKALPETFDAKLAEHEQLNNDAFYAMSESITEITDNTSAAFEDVAAKLKELTGEPETTEKDRALEKAFIEGVANIMGYEVTYGGKQAQ